MKKRHIGKGNYFWFLAVMILAVFILSTVVVPAEAKPNGPKTLTKAKKATLEEKIVQIEANLKQMKKEFNQVKKGLGEIKRGLKKLEEKRAKDLKSLDKQKKDSSDFFWLMIGIIAVLVAIFIVLLVAVTKAKTSLSKVKGVHLPPVK